MRIKLPKYTEYQLKEKLRPKQVCKEFGFPMETLANWRATTRDTGVLHGIPFFQDGDVIFLVREDVIKYEQEHSFKMNVQSSDSSDSSDKTKSTAKLAIVPK